MTFRSQYHDPEKNAITYLMGRLGRKARRKLEMHFLDCEDCWRQVLLGREGRRLAESAREVAPSELRERVRAAILDE